MCPFGFACFNLRRRLKNTGIVLSACDCKMVYANSCVDEKLPMSKIHHINCGTLLVPGHPTVVCHCLLLEDNGELALIDTGIGLLDVESPVERLGQQLIEAAGFQSAL